MMLCLFMLHCMMLLEFNDQDVQNLKRSLTTVRVARDNKSIVHFGMSLNSPLIFAVCSD